MKEEFLHFVWKNKLFRKSSLITSGLENIKVIHPGITNNHSGPDFFNAQIKIAGIIWAGNVEIHLRSSDWKRHRHHLDQAYDNVILHVVLENDMEILGTDGRIIPTIEMKIDQKHYTKYNYLIHNQQWIACQDELRKVDSFRIKYWLGKVLVERLQEKTLAFKNLLDNNRNDWEESFYQGLAKSFGFKVNSLQFERLARSLPLKYLFQHKDNLLQIEALLFGQSGLLNTSLFGDDYYEKLKKEYNFFRKKFNLKPIEAHLWKFMRMRPLNFPTIRIAQFASLLYQSENMFSKVIDAKDLNELLELFHIELSPYWKDHYQFNKVSPAKDKNLGKDAQHSILINTVIPFLFMYGSVNGLEEYKNKAVAILESVPPEKNNIVRKWEQTGIKAEDAFFSQSLIQLKNKYCNKKRCLNCEIGNRIITFNLNKS